MQQAWPFDQPPNYAAITLRQVVREGAPVLLVAHDEDDHGWQFLDGSAEPKKEDAVLCCIEHIVAADPTLLEIADLPVGWRAWRTSIGRAWTRRKSVQADHA